MLDKTVTNMKFEGPVVGIHVRRTDKVGTEAAFHPVEEYMKYVEEWFAKYELNHPASGTRRVFVASDDPKVRFFFPR
jgi:glycoprotein 6-alpha-L-fucosyltransferase